MAAGQFAPVAKKAYRIAASLSGRVCRSKWHRATEDCPPQESQIARPRSSALSAPGARSGGWGVCGAGAWRRGEAGGV
eukprot:scaffold20651_cov112-Isochrysis_galbana.AAC.1